MKSRERKRLVSKKMNAVIFLQYSWICVYDVNKGTYLGRTVRRGPSHHTQLFGVKQTALLTTQPELVRPWSIERTACCSHTVDKAERWSSTAFRPAGCSRKKFNGSKSLVALDEGRLATRLRERKLESATNLRMSSRYKKKGHSCSLPIVSGRLARWLAGWR